ncbi:TrmH family RNA methyltransferase [Candidatus Saccharibacteria bacterium]|nr:TrmH family RNA methyltransferase [Candidatus Saccharibacteria bacterium]
MEIVVIAHNIRSTHNVGAIFRSCDGFGVKHLYLSGYTPYPALLDGTDARLPHERDKLTRQIHKSALGAEATVPFSHHQSATALMRQLRQEEFQLVALEQASGSINLPDYAPPTRLALLLGEEVDGVASDLLALCDDIVEIPMRGRKESFNVSVAAGIALYALSVTR